MLRHKRPLPYSTPENQKKPKTKQKPRPREVENMLQELFYSTPRNVVFTNEEESSLYRFLEG